MKDLQKLSLLLVEDEPELRRETAAFLELYFGRVIPAANGREALECFESQTPDLVVSDIRMPVMDGLELANALKARSPETPLIFCTAFSETSYLLQAIELGVAGFVRKPVETDELLAALGRAAVPILQRLAMRDLEAELSMSLTAQLGNLPILGALPEEVARAARTSFNILLQGETGSGKSHLARIIHGISPRRNRPFVSVQLGAIPEQLVESELFGHLKGAFTGALNARTGFVEAAQGGTLFLDDVESCPPAVQAKLLRLVDEKRFTPLGSASVKDVDVRIIAASNQALQEAVQAGRFREDLYYRLADFVVWLPPLRQVREAIVPLALAFLEETCAEMGREVPLLDASAQERLRMGDWRGNIRELKSVVRRAALTAGKTLDGETITAALGTAASPPPSIDAAFPAPTPPPFPCGMDALEKWTLEQALRFCGGKRMKTAAMLGMNYYTFRRRLEKHGIAVE